MLTAEAERVITSRGAEVEGVVRIDASVVRGIAHAVLETDASLVVIGWTETSLARRAVLGSVVDDVVATVPAPVVVAHLPHLEVRRIVLLEVKGASPVEASTARDLATSMSRSRTLPVVACCDDDSPFLTGAPLKRIPIEQLEDADLVVLVAPGGSDFVRTVGDLVSSHPERPLVAIRTFAETPDGFAALAGIFGE